jgi:hypothetical protein
MRSCERRCNTRAFVGFNTVSSGLKADSHKDSVCAYLLFLKFSLAPPKHPDRLGAT